MRHSLSFLVLLCGVVFVFACAPEGEQVEENNNVVDVRIGGLFVNLDSVSIYDENMELVQVLSDSFETQLEPGFYYLDIRDDFNNTPYSLDGRLFFNQLQEVLNYWKMRS